MNTLLEFGLTNTVLTAMLAILVSGITRYWRNAHLAHALWLIVLAKLLVPPVVPLPLHVPAPVAFGPMDREYPKQISAPSPSAELAAVATFVPERQPWSEGRDELRWDDSPTMLSGTIGEPLRSTLPPSTSGGQRHAIASLLSFFPLATALTMVWLAGSVAWILLAGSRIVRFHRYLKDTQPAPECIQREARTCAQRLGLSSCPPIRLVDGLVPPMVWSAWRPIVLLPAQLIGQLTQSQRISLVAHELAHIRRRDHWVRWLEMVVLAVYWWNPCAWWARRRLQAAEEQCCDGWVVWLFPDQARAYGSALLKTVEYLSQGGRPAPVLASGFGHVPMVKRRFEMIVSKQIRPRMSSPMRVAVILAGLLVLPAAAQVVDEDTPSGAAAASEAELDPDLPAAPESRPSGEAPIAPDDAPLSEDATPSEPAAASAAAEDELDELADANTFKATFGSSGDVLEERISRLEKMIEDLARIVENQSRRRDVSGPAVSGDIRPDPHIPAVPPVPSAPVAAPPSPARRATPAEAFDRYLSGFGRSTRAFESRPGEAPARWTPGDRMMYEQEVRADNALRGEVNALESRQQQIKSGIAKTRLEMEKMQVELKYLEREWEEIEKVKQELQQRHRETSDDTVPRPNPRATPRARP